MEQAYIITGIGVIVFLSYFFSKFFEIISDMKNRNFKEFLDLVTPIVEFLTKNLEDHIYKEDNILYPMSLETLGKAEWKDVRKKFDIIGYCCFAPADIQKKPRRLP